MMEKKLIKVLLVEDDFRYTAVVREIVAGGTGVSFDLTASERLDEALRRLEHEHFDVILLDLTLPDSSGLNTFTQLHTHAPAVPIVVLTGTEDETLALEAVRQGAQDYLVKGQVEGKMLSRIMRYAIERNQVEQKVREREEFFRLISENVSDLIAVLDPDGRRLYNSPSYRALLGDPEKLVGTVSFQDIHPEDRDRVRRIFQETIASGIGQRAEYRFVLPNGSIRYVESVGNVIKNETRQIAKVVVVSRDTTERRLAEERLRHSEALYHSLVESLPQNIFRKDLDGRFTFVNQRFCQTIQKTSEEILGQTDFDIFPAALAEKYQRDDRLIIQKGEILEMVEENQPLEGSKIFVHVVKIPIYDAQGRINGIQGIFWDITERKRAEEQLKQTYAELAKSEEALREAIAKLSKSHEELKSTQLQLIQAAKLESVGTLAAGVAHEVKNPLQTILMGVEYLSKSVPSENENATMVLNDMRGAVKRADKIVRGLLQFSAAYQPDAKDEDLNAVMAQSLLFVKYELVRTRITWMADLSPDLPRVRLDKAKMEQVFINLFMNAVHAMPQGGTLTIRTRTERLAENRQLDERNTGQFKAGDTVVIAEVQDTGTGIPEANLAKIFDPFFTTKPTGDGTGLGLSVTKKIIELHGGTIDLKNGVDRGVCVTIILKAPTKE